MANQQVDREKLHAAIRKLGNEYMFYMLDEAIELLSPHKLLKLARRYIDPSRSGCWTISTKMAKTLFFFADEGGAWQVGVDWDRVLPPWFRVLSATAEPEEYAERITALIMRHFDYGRDKMLASARKTASREQRARPR